MLKKLRDRVLANGDLAALVKYLGELLKYKQAELEKTQKELQEQRQYVVSIDTNYKRLQQGEKIWRQRAEDAERRSRYLYQTCLNVRKVANGELVDGKVEVHALIEALDGVGQNG